MTITITSNEPSTIDRILHLLRREKVPFVYEPEPLDADELKTEAIRDYDDDNDGVEVLNPEEQNAFRNEMKSWVKQ